MFREHIVGETLLNVLVVFLKGTMLSMAIIVTVMNLSSSRFLFDILRSFINV
jgi:hypothetical protein